MTPSELANDVKRAIGLIADTLRDNVVRADVALLAMSLMVDEVKQHLDLHQEEIDFSRYPHV